MSVWGSSGCLRAIDTYTWFVLGNAGRAEAWLRLHAWWAAGFNAVSVSLKAFPLCVSWPLLTWGSFHSFIQWMSKCICKAWLAMLWNAMCQLRIIGWEGGTYSWKRYYLPKTWRNRYRKWAPFSEEWAVKELRICKILWPLFSFWNRKHYN